MIYLFIVFISMAGLFLCLLEDRFRLLTTLLVLGLTCLVSWGLGAFLGSRFPAGFWRDHLPVLAGALVFFGVSLFLFRNNFLQKLFLALLAAANHAYLAFALPLMLGLLPGSPAGGLGGALSVLGYLLFTLLLGLCLYRPLRHFRDRRASGFLAGMCVLALGILFLSWGWGDFLFRTNLPAARLLAGALAYGLMIFCFRSIYQAGRFRERATRRAARETILQSEMDSAEELFSAVREVKSAEKAGEYALDTVNVLLSDGLTEKIPDYVRLAKQNMVSSPILGEYHEHPALNSIIAARAAFARQNDVAFECNAVTDGSPLAIGELCLVTGELLSRACRDAAAFDGPRKVRFTVLPTQESLRFEVVYTGAPPQPREGLFSGRTASEILQDLFEERPRREDELPDLDTTRDLIARTSGSLTLSRTPENEVLLQVSFRM